MAFCEGPRQGGDAGKVPNEIERGALAGEDRACASGEADYGLTRVDIATLSDHRFESEARIKLSENAPRHEEADKTS